MSPIIQQWRCVTGKTRVLGLIVEDISNVFFASLAKIIEEEADSIGYKVLYCSTENNEDKARERVRMLSQRQVDGFPDHSYARYAWRDRQAGQSA